VSSQAAASCACLISLACYSEQFILPRQLSQAAASCACFSRRCAAFSCRCAASLASPALSRTPRIPSALPMSRLATAADVFGRGAGGASCFAGTHLAACDACSPTHNYSLSVS